MFSPPFRRVLLKSIGLGLILIVLMGIGLNRVFSWMATTGATWAKRRRRAHRLANPAWSCRCGTLGIITGALFLMPAVTAFVGSFFVDEIADEVERTHYPNEPPGTALPLFRALIEGINTALLAILVYLCAVPFLFVAGLGLVIMFVANAYLLSREYFLLAAMRFRPPAEAKAMRRAYRGQIFCRLLIAMFVSIPIVNLARRCSRWR
jgi:uncharacterized protein involved in cysteine biosynthesis